MKARRRRSSRFQPSADDIAIAVEYKAAFADMVHMAAGPDVKGIHAACATLGGLSNFRKKLDPQVLAARATEAQAEEVPAFIERYVSATLAAVERFRRASRAHLSREKKKKAKRAAQAEESREPVNVEPPPVPVDGTPPIAA